MTKITCVYCSKEFLALPNLTDVECQFCKHMQKVPRTNAGRTRRITSSINRLGSRSQDSAFSALDNIIIGRIEKSSTTTLNDNKDERVLMKVEMPKKGKKP